MTTSTACRRISHGQQQPPPGLPRLTNVNAKLKSSPQLVGMTKTHRSYTEKIASRSLYVKSLAGECAVQFRSAASSVVLFTIMLLIEHHLLLSTTLQTSAAESSMKKKALQCSLRAATVPNTGRKS
eukprot:1090-Heterococcus_DN1.PRE.2